MTHPENPTTGFQEEIVALGQAQPFDIVLTPPRAFILLSHLQLAIQIRCDTFSIDEGFMVAVDMYDNLKAKLSEVCPAIKPYLEQGESPLNNVTPGEFEALWQDAYPEDF